METNCGKGVQESQQNLARFETSVQGGELALLMPYVPVGIKETKKKKKIRSQIEVTEIYLQK